MFISRRQYNKSVKNGYVQPRGVNFLSITGILTYCDDENGATTPSLSYKIILEHQ